MNPFLRRLFARPRTVTRPGVTPFGILTVGPAVTVNLSQFKISRGNATNGGGIGVPNAAGTTLNLTSMEVSGNSAVGTDPANPAPGAGGGGGIFMDGTGTLTTDFTTIGSNGAFEGGGLLLRGGMTATFRHTTI